MSDSEKIKNYAMQGGIVVVVIGVIAAIIWFGVYIFNRSKDNGASVTQMYVGKKPGELCTSDAMCATNKCRNNFCVY
jgi:hypothetical protein